MDCLTPYYFFALFLLGACHTNIEKDFTPAKIHSYYLNTDGNDQNDGSINHPFKSISRLNKVDIQAGDTVFFEAGQTFAGNILLDAPHEGTEHDNIILTSSGSGKATIDGGNGTAIELNGLAYVRIENLKCIGMGRKDGNTKAGVAVTNCNNLILADLEISGFQKSGLQINTSWNINVDKVFAHDNGAAGIGIEGDFSSKLTSRAITITNCAAVDNPGDPTNLTNHSGNGIVAGHCTNLLIDHCMATNNGWDMPRIGNGPVGIWCYESDSVTIQHCLSYLNKTSKGAADGGGFDFDGGVTNSLIQYCFSYGNQGSGYCIFQYWGASPWHHNVMRYNISEDDGLVSDSRAGVYVWNSSQDEKQFYDCDFYNNTIYNSKQAALSFSVTSQRQDFRFFNNIFIAKDSLIRGDKGKDTFLANDWWSLEHNFNADGMSNFLSWLKKNNIEQVNGTVVGMNILPPFQNPGNANYTDASQVSSITAYKMKVNTPVTNGGLDLKAMFGIDPGDEDFNGETTNKNAIGACSQN